MNGEENGISILPCSISSVTKAVKLLSRIFWATTKGVHCGTLWPQGLDQLQTCCVETCCVETCFVAVVFKTLCHCYETCSEYNVVAAHATAACLWCSMISSHSRRYSSATTLGSWWNHFSWHIPPCLLRDCSANITNAQALRETGFAAVAWDMRSLLYSTTT